MIEDYKMENKKLLIMSHSGGLDSTTVMVKALEDGFMVLPITFQYGQKNKKRFIYQLYPI